MNRAPIVRPSGCRPRAVTGRGGAAPAIPMIAVTQAGGDVKRYGWALSP